MATILSHSNSLEDQLAELESVIEVFGAEHVQRLESKQAWGKVGGDARLT
jgi:hypothetical protein